MAAPTYDNSISAYSASNVASLTSASWAIAGNYLVGGIASGAGSPVDPSGMKWGGSGGTALTKFGSTLLFGTYFRVSAYGLVSPTVQTSTLYGNWPSNQDETCIGGISVSGVDADTPVGTVATNTGTTNTPTVDATTVADDFVVDVIWHGQTGGAAPSLTAGANQTHRIDLDSGTITDYESFGMSTEVATTTTTTMSWTASGVAHNWGIFAVPLKPSASGPTEIVGSESIGLVITEAPEFSNTSEQSEAIPSGLTEGTQFTNTTEHSETIALGLTDSAEIGGAVDAIAANESVQVGVSESSVFTNAVEVGESFSVVLTESTEFSNSLDASDSLSISVSDTYGGYSETGLIFPRNDEVTDGETVRFRFVDPHLNGLPIYGASGAGVTYIWKIKPEQQTGYYTTFFWGNDDGGGTIDTFIWDGGGSNTYYGAHPYPRGGSSGTVHDWEISVDSDDIVNGLVVKDAWYTQALRAWGAVDANKEHEFYWDLPNVDSGHKVTHQSPTYRSNVNPPSPALTFGDAPWQPGQEMLSGTLRGLQIYNALLTEQEILDEIAEPLSTVNGAASIWYLNLNPTPTDISDKSGNGHDPEWVGSNRPELYSVLAPTEISVSESLSVEFTEHLEFSNAADQSESVGINFSDSPVFNNIQSGNEAVGVNLTESNGIYNALELSESLPIDLTESTEFFATLEILDGHSITITEQATLTPFGMILAAGSESLALNFSEGSEQFIQCTLEEIISILFGESSEAIDTTGGPTTISGSESIGILFSENHSFSITGDLAENLPIGLSEATQFYIDFVTAESIQLVLLESSSADEIGALPTEVSGSESIGVQFTEAIQFINSLNQSDSLVVGLLESSALTLFGVLNVAGSESLPVYVTEQTQFSNTLESQESLQFAFLENIDGVIIGTVLITASEEIPFLVSELASLNTGITLGKIIVTTTVDLNPSFTATSLQATYGVIKTT